MLGNTFKVLFALILCVSMLASAAWAGSTFHDPKTGAPLDCPPSSYKGISKVKPDGAKPVKVKPYSGLTSRFGSLSGLNPMSWGNACCLPGPARGQFRLGTTVFFARLNAEAKKGVTTTGIQPSVVRFEDDLGFKKNGNVIWSVDAHYQFRPRWGIRYSFEPVSMETSTRSTTTFTFMNRQFTGNSQIRSKWERYTHRAGLVFNLSRKMGSTTNFFVDWMVIQDALTIGGVQAGQSSVAWDDTKNLAVLGVEFERCLKNYRGNTLAIGCKGGIAFLDDNIGYEAEAALSYLIPIKRGRFGFVKGGYRYANLKKDKDNEMFCSTTDGAFVQVGFIF